METIEVLGLKVACSIQLNELMKLSEYRGWSGGAMVLGKLPVPGRPTIWITVGQGPWRRGRVVRAALLWCRKSPYRVSSRLGCAMQRLENSLCQCSRKWVPFFELGKDKAAKGEGWAPPFISCAQDTVGL